MAATVLKTVMASGGDYTSLSAWEAGQQGDLVTGDTIQVAECYSFTDTALLRFSGWTLDADHYIVIRTPTSERHTGKWRTDKYLLAVATNYPIEIEADANFVRIEGLQVESTASSGAPNGILADLSTTAGDVRISHCIIRGVLTGTATGSGIRCVGLGTVRVWNTLVYDWVNAANACEGVLVSSGLAYLYSLTIHNCRTGCSTSVSTTVVKNTMAYGCNNGFNGTFAAASTNNLSNLASDAPGSNPQNSATVTFDDEAGDDFHLSINDTGAINLGADLSADANLAFSDDIDPDGGIRVAPWDIGADELIDPLVSSEHLVATMQARTARVYR